MSDKNDVLMGSAGEGFDDSEMKSRKKKRILHSLLCWIFDKT